MISNVPSVKRTVLTGNSLDDDFCPYLIEEVPTFFMEVVVVVRDAFRILPLLGGLTPTPRLVLSVVCCQFICSCSDLFLCVDPTPLAASYHTGSMAAMMHLPAMPWPPKGNTVVSLWTTL